jgi:hypothetical protein
MLYSTAMSPSRTRHKKAPHPRYWYGAGAGLTNGHAGYQLIRVLSNTT